MESIRISICLRTYFSQTLQRISLYNKKIGKLKFVAFIKFPLKIS